MNTGMFDSFITGHWFSHQAKEIWNDVGTLQTWLTVEATLASVQAEMGIIPDSAAAIILEKADAKLYDLVQLSRDIAFSQHPLVPVLHQFERLCGDYAAGFIHWGATTQNIFDTASAVQMLQTHKLLTAQLGEALTVLSELAIKHKDTVMAGRTHGQHALPMTFGFKVAGWIDEIHRDMNRLHERFSRSFPACMGGAIGTFAAVGAPGREVEVRLSARLGLLPAGLPSRSSYDRAADYLSALGLVAGTVQKIAQDVVFMQRTEIGEAAESFHMGKVGSSTMAQKRNPSTALLLISLTRLLRARVPLALESMVRMDEGDSSSTNVTDTLLPEIAVLAISVTETLNNLASGLIINPDAMRKNLDISNGLILSEAVMMRLSSKMGRHEAHHLLYEAAQRSQSQGIPFIRAIQEHPAFEKIDQPIDLQECLDATKYLGESVALTCETVERVRKR